jgi:peptidase E
MSINLHLFSTPGARDICDIVEASRPYLESKPDAVLAYMPLASLSPRRWQEVTEKSFKGLAQVETIDTEAMSLPEIEAVLRRANLVYIPGGNTFLLNHRLHLNKVMPYLRKKVQAGLSVVGFSAGAILCGPNILTSKDMNTVETPYFAGLNVTPFNFFVHYADDEYGRALHEDWLSDYHVFHDNPVIIMADDAYVKVEKNEIKLVRGKAWILRQGQEKEWLETGKKILV